MSCGKPHETPCSEVLDRVYELPRRRARRRRPAPRSSSTSTSARRACAEFGLEEEVKALVKRCCADPAPAELRAKVLRHIAAARAELRTDL